MKLSHSLLLAVAFAALVGAPLAWASFGAEDPPEVPINEKKADLVGTMVTDFGPNALPVGEFPNSTIVAVELEVVASVAPPKAKKTADSLPANFVHVLSCPAFGDPAQVPTCPDDPFDVPAGTDPACFGNCDPALGLPICNDFDIGDGRELLVDNRFRGSFAPCIIEALEETIVNTPSLGLPAGATLRTQAIEQGGVAVSVQPQTAIFGVFKLLVEAN